MSEEKKLMHTTQTAREGAITIIRSPQVCASEHRWRGREDLGPVLMRQEEAKEPGVRGDPGKQHSIVARQPTIKRTVATPFERMEEPEGNDFAGPHRSMRRLGDACHLVIDLTE